MLTTRCPRCDTIFRVRADQLHQRGGRVRCGKCHNAFSALETLSELPDDDPSPSKETQPAGPPLQNPGTPEARSDAAVQTPASVSGDQTGIASPAGATPHFNLDFDLGSDEDDRVPARAAAPQPAAAASLPAGPVSVPPAEEIHFSSLENDFTEADLKDEAEAREEDGPVPAQDEAEQHAGGEEAGTMFLEDELPRAAPVRKRKALAWSLLVVLLLLAALVQGVFAFRMEIAREYPALRPQLEQACEQFGCEVPLPRDAEQISVVGHDLSPDSGSEGRYRLVVTVRNKAPYPQSWPHLELTLIDRFERALSRRVLTPQEWLPPGRRDDKAFEARDEVTGEVALASDLPAMGYRVYVFYP